MLAVSISQHKDWVPRAGFFAHYLPSALLTGINCL